MNIETLKSIQLPTIKSQHLVTGLAGVFALVSVQNIAHFFIELHHPTIASWPLGWQSAQHLLCSLIFSVRLT